MSLESQARQRVEECKANIVHIDSQIRDLERLRERDRATIAALQVVLSPIAHLPCELLTEIFQIYLTVEPFPCWHVEVPFKDMLTLTHVCAYWRKIALTTPLLWVQKMFPLTLKAGGFSREATKVFLERSAPLPISVRLSDRLAPSPRFEWLPFLQDLLGSADKWRTLELSLPSLTMLTNIPPGTLKALETASLRSKATHRWGPKINAFLTAPLLHTVELHVEDPEWFPMPWSQLTCLTMTTTPQTCMATMAICSNLLSITLFTQGLPQSALSSVVTLLTLSSEGEHFKPFLRSLDLPRLKTFGMHLYEEDAPFFQWSGAAFHQFQTRSPHLECLVLDHCRITVEELRTVLLRAADLKDLRLMGHIQCVDDDLLRALRYRQSDSELAPKLETLWFEYITAAFDEETLEEVIGSRWLTGTSMPTPARLKHVQYSDGREKTFTRRFLDEMDRYRFEGLKVAGQFEAEDD
ncbi:hypothetical protein C8F04DRAFT_1388603 [Mycena alexandri]|uniref:F-box domain-containing protein n=1 Tax=Mycena alexandri TaxID=1745969 RepID=A0AAD6TGX4_9AGAR|nr:hypothetical protein C8F04DRAFT_1388603 [Mycena alexandri]